MINDMYPFPILFDKVHAVLENHATTQMGRRGPYLPTGYILFQLLRILGFEACTEEFNTLSGMWHPKTKKKAANRA
jgi:hypothetical protein